MSPWTALLESIHSSAIDEFNARLPKVKPELGMPVRLSSWGTPPGSRASEYWVIATEIGGIPGWVSIGADAALGTKLGLDIGGFWAAILRRAGAEFSRRGIQPKFNSPVRLTANDALPKGTFQPTRVIWIPFGISGATCVIGIGA